MSVERRPLESEPGLLAMQLVDVGLVGDIRRRLSAGTGEPLSRDLASRLQHAEGREQLRLVAAVLVAFGHAVEEALSDGLVEPEDERRLLRFIERSGLRSRDFDVNGSLSRLAQASARAQVLGGLLPLWFVGTSGITEAGGSAPAWRVAHARAHRGAGVQPPAEWAAWMADEETLAAGLDESIDLERLEPFGTGALDVDAGALTLHRPGSPHRLPLEDIRALELRLDALVVHESERTLALVVEEAWLLGEILRLLAEGRRPRAPGRPSRFGA